VGKQPGGVRQSASEHGKVQVSAAKHERAQHSVREDRSSGEDQEA
jgi:hypothetical protein